MAQEADNKVSFRKHTSTVGYNLELKDLEADKFYQYINGDIVIAVRVFSHIDPKNSVTPYSLTTGVGGFNDTSRFRELVDSVINICV